MRTPASRVIGCPHVPAWVAPSPPPCSCRCWPPRPTPSPWCPPSAVRAINLARTTVVRLNGGLSVYRPAQCMFASPVPENPCLASDDANGYRFLFVGGAPAWEQVNRMPTRESEILIDPEGREVKEVIYNGDLRPDAPAPSAWPAPTRSLSTGDRGSMSPPPAWSPPSRPRGIPA